MPWPGLQATPTPHSQVIDMYKFLLPLASLLLVGSASAQSIVTQWAPGTIFPGGLDYNETTQQIWIADETAVTLNQYDRLGVLIGSYPTPGTLPIGVGCDPATNTVWLGDESETVYEIDGNTGLATGVQWSTTAAITDLSGVAFNPTTGTIWVSQDSGTRTAAEFDSAGNLLQTVLLGGAGSTDPDGLAFNPQTNTLFLGEDTLNLILEVDLSGNLLNSWDMGALGISPEGLGLDLANGLVIISDGGGGNMVYEVDGMISAGPTGPALATTGAPGGPMSFAFSNFGPGEQIAVVYGPAGSLTGNIPCGSVTINLLPLNYPPVSGLILLTADAAGAASLSQNVPGAAAGLLVQGVGTASCGASSAVTL